MPDNETLSWSDEIGSNAFRAILEMVKALQCDYDRLDELRDERDCFEMDEDANGAPDGPSYENDAEAWAGENPEDAEELDELTEAAGECESEEEAHDRITEDPLSIRVFGERRGDKWEPDRFEVLLTTGGPAVRIVGDLDEQYQPSRPRLEVQDWGKPWTEYSPADRDTLQAYVDCLYFLG